jgi:hypothetical protein
MSWSWLVTETTPEGLCIDGEEEEEKEEEEEEEEECGGGMTPCGPPEDSEGGDKDPGISNRCLNSATSDNPKRHKSRPAKSALPQSRNVRASSMQRSC